MNTKLIPVLLLLTWLCGSVHAATPPYVWVEGEAPASVTPTAVTPKIEDVGTPQYLSGGKWLHISVGQADVDKSAPNGVTVSYAFTAPQSATYEIWDRVGYQASRSAFTWRVDGGAEQAVPIGAPFVQIQQLQTWNDVSWMHLGDLALTAGPHTFTFHIPKTTDAKGKTQDLNFACDALCFSAGPFHPNDQYKPDDTSWETAADKAAAQKVFAVTNPTGAEQTATPLTGGWQMARDEEATLHDVDGPIPSVADQDSFSWRATPVPGNVFDAHPEWLYAHRYLLRTQVNVPAKLTGRSFVLHFPSLSMLATVFVNGQQCGFDNTPYAAWDCDITQAIKPGQVNQIVVGIKDWYYALPDEGAKEGGTLHYIPTDWVTKFGPASFTYPVWNHTDSGILNAPTLIVGGPVYTSDVFCEPSVSKKNLTLAVTVTNPGAQEQTVQVGNAVAPMAGGPAEKTFAAQSVTVPANGSKTVNITEGWANPKLWWPDSPQQYFVTTTLTENGKVLDSRQTKFGFREWTWAGDTFQINGVPWHGRADLADYGQADDAAVALWHKHGQNMQRMWGMGMFSGLDPDQALDFYDSRGIPIRRTGIFDGEDAAYHLDQPGLWDHYRQQLAAWIRGERNHPSIFIWSVENEITFINGHVFGQDKLTTQEHHQTAQMVAAVDPTRPFMVDGGNALLDESFPVYGGHYMEPPMQSLPEGAYNDRIAFAHRQVWPVTEQKPILLGESFYWSGDDPGDFATTGGASAFLGRAEAAPAIGLTAKMLSEGYRWDGISFQFWGANTSDAYYNAWQPVAVLCREWDSAFASGKTIPRTVKIFNDTRDAAPITLRWTLTFHGHPAVSGTKTYTVAPGGSTMDTVTLHLPRTTQRLDGTWTLHLLRAGKPVFGDEKSISVLPADPVAKPGSPALVAVYDPSGVVQKFLTRQGIAFRPVTSLALAPASAKALIIGPDALTPAQAGSSALAAYAAPGRAVIVLEQRNPLRFQALPGAMTASEDTGDIAFLENPDDPLFQGLEQHDFFTWGADGTVYKDAYQKPTSGGRSLVQCGFRLADTALAEMTPGKGLMLLSQLVIGQKLTTNAVAQRLLLNMIRTAETYKQTFRPVSAAVSSLILRKTLDAIDLQYQASDSPLAALAHPSGIAVIEATPGNLAALAAHLTQVRAFTAGGGWIIFNNLTPEGLASYNTLVGVDHLIRRFGQNPTDTSVAGSQHIEKVTFATPENPLLAGLSASDIVLNSGHRVFNYQAGEFPDENGYSYVVDTGDIAPFATSSWGSYGNIVNGFTQEDGFWPLIVNFPAPTDGKPLSIPITLPRTETITRFRYAQDLNYQATTQISLLFDGTNKQTFAVKPNGDVQTFAISPPRAAKTVTLEIDSWDPKSDGGKTLLGLDNIWLDTKQAAGWVEKVKPMLNIGALVEYPQGKGGMVLCNVKFQDTEANPENIGKKQNIIATLLKNLQAPFSGGKSLIAGAKNLTYTPIDIRSKVNQYTTDQGWFGDKAHTFTDLPGGLQTYAGVPYQVFSFTTSPVPTVIMLGGTNIPGNLPAQVTGIPVGRKADALFFLQAARIDQPMSDDDRKKGRTFEMADYLVHYADGTTETVPIDSQISVENYRQTPPAAVIPGAQIAWQKPYADGSFAVAYSMQWNNPHPDKEIQSVDLVPGPDRARGVPALLALTAASAP